MLHGDRRGFIYLSGAKLDRENARCDFSSMCLLRKVLKRKVLEPVPLVGEGQQANHACYTVYGVSVSLFFVFLGQSTFTSTGEGDVAAYPYSLACGKSVIKCG